MHVKLLLADNKAFSHHMTVRACAGHQTLLIPIRAWITDWELPANPSAYFLPPVFCFVLFCLP